MIAATEPQLSCLWSQASYAHVNRQEKNAVDQDYEHATVRGCSRFGRTTEIGNMRIKKRGPLGVQSNWVPRKLEQGEKRETKNLMSTVPSLLVVVTLLEAGQGILIGKEVVSMRHPVYTVDG